MVRIIAIAVVVLASFLSSHILVMAQAPLPPNAAFTPLSRVYSYSCPRTECLNAGYFDPGNVWIRIDAVTPDGEWVAYRTVDDDLVWWQVDERIRVIDIHLATVVGYDGNPAQPQSPITAQAAAELTNSDSLYAQWRNTPDNTWLAGTDAELKAFIQHMATLGIRPATADEARQRGYPEAISSASTAYAAVAGPTNSDSLYAQWRNTPDNTWLAGTDAELKAFIQHMAALGIRPATADEARQRGYPEAISSASTAYAAVAGPTNSDSLYAQWRNTPDNTWLAGTDAELKAFIQHMAALGIRPATADEARQRGYPEAISSASTAYAAVAGLTNSDSLYAQWRNTLGNTWPAETEAELNAFIQHMVAIGIWPATVDEARQHGYP